MLGRLVGRCTLGMSFVFRENSGWHGVATPVCQQSGLSPWHVYLCWGKEFHYRCKLGGSACKYKVVRFCLFSEERSLGTWFFQSLLHQKSLCLSLHEEPRVLEVPGPCRSPSVGKTSHIPLKPRVPRCPRGFPRAGPAGFSPVFLFGWRAG